MTQDKDSKSDKPGAESGKKPRRVAKTMLETDVDVSAVLKAAKELDKAAHPAHTENIAPGADAAHGVSATDNSILQSISRTGVPAIKLGAVEPAVQTGSPVPPQVQGPSVPEPPATQSAASPASLPAAKPEKKRRVAKTLLFGIGTDNEDIHDGAGLHQVQAQSQSTFGEGSGTPYAKASSASAPVSGDHAPASSSGVPAISSPVVGAPAPFQTADAATKKTTQSSRKPIRKIAKTLVFNEVDEFTDSGIHQSLSAGGGQSHSLYHPLSVESTHAAPAAPDLGLVHADKAHPVAPHPFPAASDHSLPAETNAATQSNSTQSNLTTSDANALAPAPVDASRKRRRGAGQYVAKTMLDQSVLAETVLKSVAKLEVKVKEELKERANEPVKPFVPVVCDKVTLPCAWSWTETGTAKRFKVCDLCQKNVYDFTDMEMPEAEKLIFQRENLEKFTLYKRPDGKYMTSDCPLQLKRKRDFNMMIAVGLSVAVAVVVLLSMLPQQPKTASKPTAAPETPGKETHITKLRKIDHTSVKPDEHGTYHYRSDDTAQVEEAAGTTAAQTGGTAPVQAGGATAIFPEPPKPQGPAMSQEGGDFWVNPDGGTYSSDTVITGPNSSSSQGAGH